ncbi:MAG: threonine synthase [Gammaproteobacteria bacterium]|nr:threonine synthase [Gammaproteobacteria bacterium]
MLFTETRGNDGIHAGSVSFSDAILSPVASFGGIYSPRNIPSVDTQFLSSQIDASYKALSLALLELFQVDVDTDILKQAVELYDRFDNPDNPVPLVKISDRVYISELYHGPTRAFKDMALQPFGLILSELARQQNQQYLILTATSGDTGPAALETFRQRDNIRVACLYPCGGTSDVQRLQMVTESADNLKVIGIDGNFDDAQAALKSLLASSSFSKALSAHNIALSAANSVNFGRIIFQIIYQFHSYLELLRQQKIEVGEEVNLHIPSGNFGNALGAFYAKKMGLPVARIYIASNVNNVLTEWINSGKYDLSSRRLITTNSPAMDILKSSNVERILFDLFGQQRTRDLMKQLDENGFYQLNNEETDQIQAIFSASFCSDEEGQQYISKHFGRGYLMDPHTATCFKSCELADDQKMNIVYSTAEWTKFAPTIDLAINGNRSSGDLESLNAIARTANIDVPDLIEELFSKPVCHDGIVDKADIEAQILAFVDKSVQS